MHCTSSGQRDSCDTRPNVICRAPPSMEAVWPAARSNGSPSGAGLGVLGFADAQAASNARPNTIVSRCMGPSSGSGYAGDGGRFLQHGQIARRGAEVLPLLGQPVSGVGHVLADATADAAL